MQAEDPRSGHRLGLPVWPGCGAGRGGDRTSRASHARRARRTLPGEESEPHRPRCEAVRRSVSAGGVPGSAQPGSKPGCAGCNARRPPSAEPVVIGDPPHQRALPGLQAATPPACINPAGRGGAAFRAAALRFIAAATRIRRGVQARRGGPRPRGGRHLDAFVAVSLVLAVSGLFPLPGAAMRAGRAARSARTGTRQESGQRLRASTHRLWGQTANIPKFSS